MPCGFYPLERLMDTWGFESSQARQFKGVRMRQVCIFVLIFGMTACQPITPMPTPQQPIPVRTVYVQKLVVEPPKPIEQKKKIRYL